MAITRKKKEELVALYKENVEGSSALVFTDYRGVNVSNIQSLRNKLRENDTTYMVVKNTLLGIALEQAGQTPPAELLNGTNAVAFVGDDIGKGVTALKDWIKEKKAVSITGGLLGSSPLDPERTEALADLPTKKETLAKLLATINAPASQLVRTINEPARSLAQLAGAPGSSLVRVLSAHVEKQKAAEA